MNVFIGGSKNLTVLPNSAADTIEEYINAGYCILIGDCYGIDLCVQTLLKSRGYNKVTVYCSGDAPRNNVGGWPVIALHSDKKGYDFYRRKDIAMVKACDCGLMIWNGTSKGTKQNICDLERICKPVQVEFAP